MLIFSNSYVSFIPDSLGTSTSEIYNLPKNLVIVSVVRYYRFLLLLLFFKCCSCMVCVYSGTLEDSLIFFFKCVYYFFLLDYEGLLQFDYFLAIETFPWIMTLGKCGMGHTLCLMIYYIIILGFGFFDHSV